MGVRDLIGRVVGDVTAKVTGTQVATLSGPAARVVGRVGAVAKKQVEPTRLVFINDLTGSRDWNLPLIKEIFHELEKLVGSVKSEHKAKTGNDLEINIEIGIANHNGNGYQGLKWFTLSGAKEEMAAATTVGGETHIHETFVGVSVEIKGKKIDGIALFGDSIDGDKSANFHQLASIFVDAGIPMFVFHEGHDSTAENAFRQMADVSRSKLNNGFFTKFDRDSLQKLVSLFKVVVAVRSRNQHLLEAVRNDRTLTQQARELLPPPSQT
jgi:hypothetical protein